MLDLEDANSYMDAADDYINCEASTPTLLSLSIRSVCTQVAYGILAGALLLGALLVKIPRGVKTGWGYFAQTWIRFNIALVARSFHFTAS